MSTHESTYQPGVQEIPLRRETRPTFLFNLLTIAGGQLGCSLLAALSELCFARVLGPASRGLISLCLMSIAFGALIGSVGSEATVVVWMSRFRQRHTVWFPAVCLWVCIGSCISVLLWGVVFWRIHPTFLKGLTQGLAILVLASIPCTVLFSMLMALLMGEERFHLRSSVALFNRVASLLAFFASLLCFGRRAEVAILGNLIGLVCASCVALFFLRHFFVGAWRLLQARDNLLPTAAFGMRGQAGNLASFFSYRLDVFVVNYFLDASQLGLYAVGVLVSEALWQLPGIVSIALFPRTARTVGAGADRFTCMVLRQVFLITTLAGILIAAFSPLLIPVLFGARYQPSIEVIWWLLPGTIALALGKVIAADLAGRALNIHLPISAFIGFVLTLGADLLLIPRMGIRGAALASSIAYFAASTYLFVVIQRELKASWRILLLPATTEWLAYARLWSTFKARFGMKEVSGKV